jgi:hypothetical protein
MSLSCQRVVIVSGEESVEDRPGDEVLSEHLDRVLLADGVVQVAA